MSPRRSKRSQRPPARYRGPSQSQGQVAAAVQHFSQQAESNGPGQQVGQDHRQLQQDVVDQGHQPSGLSQQMAELQVDSDDSDRIESGEDTDSDDEEAPDSDPAQDIQDQDGGQQGDMLELQDRAQPEVPQPVAAGQDQVGWKAIDRLGGWRSFLVECRMLEEVPEQHKGAWANAWCEVLRKVRDAQSSEEKDRALLRLGFLPQALQRKPARGGRVGRQQVAYRYNCLTTLNWAALVTAWEKDREKEAALREERGRSSRVRLVREDRERNELVKVRKEVLALLESGQVSRAMGRVTSNGVGDCSDPDIQRQVRDKFPQRVQPLPDKVLATRPIDSFRDLRGSLLSLDAGVSPGSGGLRNEYLVALGERLDDEGLRLLEEFALAYIGGELPP